MKTIGLIGGMSWESSLEYYRIINQETNRILGGLHSAQSLMFSVDFQEIETLQHAGKWQDATDIMVHAAKRLEHGGADFVVICTNTMHKTAQDVEQHINIPLLHIADATARRITTQGYKKIGLLGTKFTMEQDFYTGRLRDIYELDVIIPNEEDRHTIHNVIYHELCLGVINPASRTAYLRIMDTLQQAGAEAIILGCTEISLLVQQQDTQVPLFDTTRIHAESAVIYALQ